MKFPNIKEIAPSESGYPVRDYSFKPNDDKEFRERLTGSDSYFRYLFKNGFVSIYTANRRYFCRDGIVHRVDR